jgi:hypothetical protein
MLDEGINQQTVLAIIDYLMLPVPWKNHTTYLGAGLSLTAMRDFKDIGSAEASQEIERRQIWSIGIRSVFGCNWSIHPRLSLFAEYYPQIGYRYWLQDEKKYEMGEPVSEYSRKWEGLYWNFNETLLGMTWYFR